MKDKTTLQDAMDAPIYWLDDLVQWLGEQPASFIGFVVCLALLFALLLGGLLHSLAPSSPCPCPCPCQTAALPAEKEQRP